MLTFNTMSEAIDWINDHDEALGTVELVEVNYIWIVRF